MCSSGKLSFTTNNLLPGFHLEGGGAGGKLPPQTAQLPPPKEKEKEREKGERERKRERERERERGKWERAYIIWVL